MAQVRTVGTIRATDERAFANLLEALVEPGYRLACAMLHDPHAAQDVVQDASVVAWRKAAKLADHGSAKSWFLGIVANECRNARRRKWSRSVSISEGHSPKSAVASIIATRRHYRERSRRSDSAPYTKSGQMP